MSEKLYRFVLVGAVLLVMGAAVKAGTVTDPHTAVPGATILSSDLNARFSTLYALVNGQLDNANFKSAAALNPTKLDLTKEFPILRPLSTDRGVSVGVTGDTQARSAIRGDGSHTFGPGGSTAFDTILKRIGVGSLAVRNAADDANGALTVGDLTVTGALSTSGTTIVQSPGGRLTLTSDTPVTTSDVTAATNLYITPDKSNVMPSYSATDAKYTNRTFSQITVSLSGISNATNYDVFVRYSSGWAGSLVAWSNSTTRATALARSSTSGLLYKSGDEEYLYLGTIRASANNQCEDSTAKRYVWNMYNRVTRYIACADATNSWTYSTAAYQEARAQSSEGTSRVGFVRGLDDEAVTASSVAVWDQSTPQTSGIGIGLDSSTVNSSTGAWVSSPAVYLVTATVTYGGLPGLGYHTLRRLEYGAGSGTTTWYGDNGATIFASGLKGTVSM